MNITYILFLFVLMGLAGCNSKQPVNWAVGLNREGKDPYDLYLGFHALGYYYPEAQLHTLSGSLENFRPTNSGDSSRKLMILIGKALNFTKDERDILYNFVTEGNDLILCSSSIDPQLLGDFDLEQEGVSEQTPLYAANSGALNEQALSIESLPDERFGFFGRNLRSYFVKRPDSTSAYEAEEVCVGNAYEGNKPFPNILCEGVGEGHIVLTATPLIFSNFFLLQPHNRKYMDAFWRHIGAGVTDIYWGNYQYRNPGTSDWQLLMKHPAIRAAVLMGLLLMLVYLLVERKRKQRIIPEIPAVENTYASFIETVGALYYHHKDNRNLCLKLEQHFLEWVRTRFLLATEVLDEKFVNLLSAKSGVDKETVNRLVQMMHEVRIGDAPVSDAFLFEFYSIINVFYRSNGTDGYSG